MSIAALRETRARVIEAAKGIVTAAENEGRSLTDEETRNFDKAMADADAAKAQLERVERLEAEERSLSESQGRRTHYTQGTFNSGDSELRSYLLGQTNPGPQGFKFELRAQSVGTAAAGGYTVQTEPMAALEVALQSFGGMRGAARIMRTSTGADLPIPALDDTANVAQIVGENVTLGSGPDFTFSQFTMKAHKYSSGIILVPFELLQDASINVGEIVGGALGTRIARATNAHFTTGTGVGQPQGVATAAPVGVTGATLGTVTYDELVSMVHSVDAAYRRNGAWMLNDQTLAAIRKVKDSQGRPLFWSDAASLANGVEGTILGYRYVVNNDLPDLATSTASGSLLFGDFSAGYIIRDVQDVQIIRLNERYADTGQVAFVGLSRHDGRLVDAGGHPIKAYENPAA